MPNNQRYAPQMALPGWGEATQAKLAQTKILCIGAGGLGSGLLPYLASAGIGTLGIIDDDFVDESNLHRQTLYRESDLGQAKVICAKQYLTQLNPQVKIQTYQQRLNKHNAADLIAAYDIIVDGSDNFTTRCLVDTVCRQFDRCNVSASVEGVSGYCTVFSPTGPCYRCLFPTLPPSDKTPNCSRDGVLGPLAGALGIYQAIEALKLATGLGTPLIGQILHMHSFHNTIQIFMLKPDPHCPVCQANQKKSPPPRADNQTMSINAFNALLAENANALQIIDVREPAEYKALHLVHAQQLPLSTLHTADLSAFNPQAPTILYCLAGKRSETALRFLANQGWQQLVHLDGGLSQWLKHTQPTLLGKFLVTQASTTGRLPS